MGDLAAKLGAFVAVVAFGGAIGWLNIGAWSAWVEQRRLDETGIRTMAEVVETRVSDVPRSDGQWVTVRFDVSGEPLTVDVAVDEATLGRAIGSGTLEVVFAADDPSVVRIVGDGRKGAMAVIAGVVDLTLVGGLAVLVINDRKRRPSEDGSG